MWEPVHLWALVRWPVPRPLARGLTHCLAGVGVTDEPNAARRQSHRERALLREAEAARRQAEALYAAALAIGGESDLDARLQRVLDAALALTGAQQAGIALTDPDTGEIEVVAARGPIAEMIGSRQPAGSGLTGEVLRRNATVRSDDLSLDQRVWDGALPASHATRSWLGVPLADASGPFGVLVLLSSNVGAFDGGHERLLDSFAALAGAAIREARLHDRMRGEIEQRRRAHHELRASEARYRSLTDSLLEAVYEADMTNPLKPGGVPILCSSAI